MTSSRNDGAGIADRSRELRRFLRDFGVDLDHSFSDEEQLISSGRLDSLALFQLILWVEGKIGRAIDPGSMELARELDSIRQVLEYVDHARGGTATREPLRKPAPRNNRGVEIVRYTASDKAAVAKLQTGLWSKDQDQNTGYLEWKYEANPFAGEPRIYLAFQQDELIGMRGFYASRWELGQSAGLHDILVADDLVLKESHRNQGYVHQIMRTALADLDQLGEEFVFNLSGGPLTVLNSLAMGWKSVGRLEPIRRGGRAARLRRRARLMLSSSPTLWRFSNLPMLRERAGRSPFHGFDRLDGCRSRSGIRVNLSREPRPEQMAGLVGQVGHDGCLRHIRDSAFLNWRLRNPLAEYRFCYVGDESLDGYAILRRSVAAGDGDSKVVVADLEAIDDRTRNALLDAVAGSGAFDELYAWSATLKPGDIEFLKHAGFRPAVGEEDLHEHPQIIVRPASSARLEAPWCLDGVPLLDWRNWDMRMIYSMAG